MFVCVVWPPLCSRHTAAFADVRAKRVSPLLGAAGAETTKQQQEKAWAGLSAPARVLPGANTEPSPAIASAKPCANPSDPESHHDYSCASCHHHRSAICRALSATRLRRWRALTKTTRSAADDDLDVLCVTALLNDPTEMAIFEKSSTARKKREGVSHRPCKTGTQVPSTPQC